MDLIDISMKIKEDMPVYPGNPAPQIEEYRSLPEESTTESELELGSHTGTHVDAPAHVFKDGKSIAEMDLEGFYGPCQVIDLQDAGSAIGRDDLEGKSLEHGIVLLKTENSLKGYDSFREDFAHLTLDGVKYLVENGVRTVGIDYLSLVEFEGGDEAGEAHRLANQRMTVFEGLDLRDAEPGEYIFSGFPLKIEADGSPARAVLIRD